MKLNLYRLAPGHTQETGGLQRSDAAGGTPTVAVETTALPENSPMTGVMKLPHCNRPRAFTLVEIMVAIALFMMIMGSIMACWKSIISGTQTGEKAAAMAQRARNSMRALEDSLNNLEISRPNIRYYSFVADTSDPQYANLEFTACLPASFLGSDYFGDRVMRRVIFHLEKDQENKLNLVMTQYPLLDIPSPASSKSIVLARDVSAFCLEFWSPKDEDWLSEFLLTNEVPPMIRITLGTGHSGSDGKTPFELIQRVVAPAALAHL